MNQPDVVVDPWRDALTDVIAHAILSSVALIIVAVVIGAVLGDFIYPVMHALFLIGVQFLATARAVKLIRTKFKLLSMYKHMVTLVNVTLCEVMHKNINLPDADGLTDAQFNHLFSPDAPPKALAEALKHRLDILKQGLEITDVNLGLCQQIVTALGDCNIRDIPEAEIKSTFKNCLDLIAATRKATKTCLP